ncbi:telomere length regulation protein-domain-containing protein [Phellopilus nigrolimitatus]|nr:telomere length regulation protein-domain-containing protein [Phellopilus nigrolimitatus]
MTAEYNALALTQIRETITRLQSPISDLSTLLSLLAAPLDTIGLLPPVLRRFNTHGFSAESKEALQITKHMTPIQTALLDSIVPTWGSALREQQLGQIFHQYICPDSFFSATQAAGEVALCAYTALLSFPLQPFSIEMLALLSCQYPIDRLHNVIFAKTSSVQPHRRTSAWEDLVRIIVSVPSRIANKSGTNDIPQKLHQREFYNFLCSRVEILVSSFSRTPDSEISSSLSFLISKMINVGMFPSTPMIAPSQSSFFSATLPTIRSRLATLSAEGQSIYTEIWTDLFMALPSGLFSKALTSLFAHISDLPDNLDTSHEARGLMKREGRLISQILGNLEGDEDEKWLAVSSVLLMRCWDISKARILVCWVTLSEANAVPPRALETLLSQIMDVWSSTEHVKHSLLSHHQYLTTLLLLTVSSFPLSSAPIQELSFSPAFIGAISTYIKHLDPAVRRCGMLSAEIVAQNTGKKLDFEQWDGQGQGREWARGVRTLIAKRDVDAEEAAPDVIRLEAGDQLEHEAGVEEETIDVTPVSSRIKSSTIQVVDDGSDSDDSLEGYATSPASSRSPSPTPSELREIEKDPTIHVGKKKIQRPVYLVDLGNLITSSTKADDPQNADRIEMALNCAEELIRRKKTFGFELEENAVNLVYAFTALQNNFELEGFDEKRQTAVTALVACCPKKAVPAIIDEFFKNQYSTAQRFVMLNALAIGARELASLPIPPSTVPVSRIAFPSKQLPAAQHKKLIEYNDIQVQKMLDDISRAAIESGKTAAEAQVAPLVRERQLRIKQPTRISEVAAGVTYVPKETTFIELAAEYFLGPLMGKFWLFLRDEQVREARSTHRATIYRGTGTGLILSPLVLQHFLGTLVVLLHAARHSPAFLAVLAPDALELAVTLGTRPLSGADEDKEREAAVLNASFELALVVLDGCLNLDGGRSLGLEHTNLLLGTGEWAAQVLNALESGTRVQGGGGAQEVRLRRSAAGVVLKVDELSSKWRQSMITI